MPPSASPTLIFFGAHPDDETFGLGGTLAHYAAKGVRVIYACATRGEVGSATADLLRPFQSPGDMRWAELKCAAGILGLADVLYLGYRDSGMPGSPDNLHPQALAAAPLTEVAGRVVQVIRDWQPQVVVTFDPIGGYRHPDHIAIHKATVHAFHAASDPAQYPECGPAFAPAKLYFHIFPKGFLKLAVKILPLLGQNPRRLGRNHDIDLASLAEVEFPTHAKIHLTGQAVAAQQRASACHRSQLDGGPRLLGFNWIGRLLGGEAAFLRAYPPVPPGRRPVERDLFEDL